MFSIFLLKFLNGEGFVSSFFYKETAKEITCNETIQQTKKKANIISDNKFCKQNALSNKPSFFPPNQINFSS